MDNAQIDREAAPPAFLRLVGHGVRWRLLNELARSDRTVRELTGLVTEPQNLVSYHLGQLRSAELVSGRRSSADGRDTYYRVDLGRLRDGLAATGAALHPGLGLGPSAAGPPAGSPAGRLRVLYLCTGNSARSQMAEALTRQRSRGRVEAHSAGSHPKPLHPAAVRVMRDGYGLDLATGRSKHLSVFADQRFDYVISLCDRVREVCPEFPGHPETIHWSMPDPAAVHGDDDEAGYPVFRQTAADIETRVGFLLAAVAVGPARPQPREAR